MGKKFSFFLGLLFFGLIIGSPALIRAADTASELQAKIDAQNKSIDALSKEIASYQNQILALGKEKDTLANAIKLLTLESKKLAADVSVTEGKIRAANLKLESLGASIQKTGSKISDLKAAIRETIRDIAASDHTSFAEMLVSKTTFSDAWRYAAERDALSLAIREKTKDLSTTKTVLESNEKEVEALRADLLGLKARLRDQQTINKKSQAQKNSLLASTKNQEASYQKLVAQKAALKAQLEKELSDYESQLKYVLTPGLLPPPGSRPLAWPLDYVYITQQFGKTVAAKRLYVTGSHSGTDFRAAVGTPVKAMAGGVVVGSGNTDLTCPGSSYGNWILIRYNNGLTSVYGHLSLVSATKGQSVSTGQIVAYSGNTGYSTGPHLHVSLFPNDGVQVSSFPSKTCNGRIYTMPVAATNAYLDPLLYMPKY